MATNGIIENVETVENVETEPSERDVRNHLLFEISTEAANRGTWSI